jgi:hypothetical protein
MDSLRWVDQTYYHKHKTEDPHNLRALYHQNLEQYPNHAPKPQQEKKTPLKQAVIMYATKQGRKAGISLAVLGLSYLPYVGRFVLPAASFYTFRKAVGTQPAGAIFVASLLFPRTYFSSRTLMRELVCSAPSLLIEPPTDNTLARTVLCACTIQQGSEKAVVQRPCWGFVRFRSRLLHLRQDTPCGSAHLRSCRSLDGIPHYQGH